MYKATNAPLWNQYLETPRTHHHVVKLDRILKQRMKVFMKARRNHARAAGQR